MASCIYIYAKVWVCIFSAIIFLGGITLIVIDFVLFNFDEILPTRDFSRGGTAVIWVLFSLGVSGIIFGVIGFIGAFKQNRSVIGIYICGMIFFILILWTLSILFFVLFGKLDDNFTCTDLGILKQTEEMNTRSYQLLCSSKCPCNAQKDWLVSQLESNGFSTSASGKVKVQDCPSFEIDVGNDLERLYKSMQWIEKKFDCAGICSKPPYFLYSDINNGPPTKFCINEIRDKGRDVSLAMGIVCLSIGFLFCITLGKSLCICCISPETYLQMKQQQTHRQNNQRVVQLQEQSTQLRPQIVVKDNQQNNRMKIKNWDEEP